MSILFIQICYVAFLYITLNEQSYLPPPFVNDKFDTFMDLFNTLSWGNTNLMYSIWHSVYPPLNFIFTRLGSIAFSYQSWIPAIVARESSENIIFALILYSVIFPMLVMKFKLWDVVSIQDKIIIYFIFIFSPVFLFAVERGNLILILPLILAFTLSNHPLSKILGIPLLANLKLNLALLFIYFLVKKEFKNFFISIFISSLIFLIAGYLIGDNPFLIFDNYLTFTEEKAISTSNQLYSSVNMSGLYLSLADERFTSIIGNFSGDTFIKLGLDFIKLVNFLGISYVALTIIKASYKALDLHESAFLITLILLFTLNIGSFNLLYNLVLLLPIIPVILKSNSNNIKLLFILLFVQLDFFSYNFNIPVQQWSYLSHDYVYTYNNPGLGSFLRPIIFFSLTILFAYNFTKISIERSLNEK